jgi:GntR family transcriptional regulator
MEGRQLLISAVSDRGSVVAVPAPHSGSRYRLVAAELRRRIDAGVYPRGSLLPSEKTLQVEFGASRGTIREAIRLLREEGLLDTEYGRGSIVRPEQPVRRLGSDRYRRELEQIANGVDPATSFTADQGIDWSQYRLDKEFQEVAATPALAELFEAEAGVMLLERRFVFHAQGVPQQMAYSYYPLDLVAGTALADPANEPWPGGNTAQLYSIGVRITQIVERVRARMPLPDEIDTLRIPPGVPVVTITRQTLAGKRIVEVAVDIVIPADRVELRYTINLQD